MNSDRFYELIANAANSSWRLDYEYFEPCNNISAIKERLDRFKNSTSSNEDEWLKWLERTHQSEDRIAKSLDDVKFIGDSNNTPVWSQYLRLFIGEHDDALTIDSLNARCRAIISKSFECKDILTSNSIDDISKALARRIYRIIWQTAFCSYWNSIEIYLERYPAIAFRIGICTEHFVNAYLEAIQRFAQDKENIQEIFFQGRSLGPIRGIACDLGDPHNFGRNVMIFEFQQDEKLVYKPKDLLGTQIFLATSNALNEKDSCLNLHVRKIYARQDYGWEEFIRFSECTTLEQVEHWFYSLGATLRLVQLFGGRDFWADNFISTSTHSAPIDIETLLQPTFLTNAVTANQKIIQKLTLGPLASGMIYMPMQSSGSGAGNLAVFTQRRELSTPLSDVTGKKIKYELPKFLATYDGVESNPFEYSEVLIKGYERLSSIFNSEDNFFACIPQLSTLANAPQRFIWRSTWDYYLLLDELSTERNSRNGVEGDIYLQKMYRSLQKAGYDSDLAVAVTSCEIKSLLNRDIPFFQVVPYENDVFYNDEKIGQIQEESTYSEFLNRINNLKSFRLDSDVQQIKSGVAFSRNLCEPNNTSSASISKSISVNQSIVDSIGNRLCDLLIEGDDGSVGVISALYNHNTKNWYLGSLPQESSCGLIGVAYTLMELNKTNHSERYLHFCRKIIQQFLCKNSFIPSINTLSIMLRIARDLNDSDLINHLTELVKLQQNDLVFTRHHNSTLIDTHDSMIPWLNPNTFNIDAEISLFQAKKNIQSGHFSYFDLRTLFESYITLGENENAIKAMEDCFGSYKENRIGGLNGIAPEHAPCAVLGLASLPLMYSRVNNGSPSIEQVHLEI